MRLCVIGTGYVGLVAGACFSDSGNHVTCLDVNKEKIQSLNNGAIPIFEPGLEEIISRNVKGKRLFFTTDAQAALKNAQGIFIAVGTPSGEDGQLDLRYVFEVSESIADYAELEGIVVLKSTVPVGTADKVRERLKRAKAKMDVVSNPEFLKEGTAVDDFMRPERVIVGCQSEKARRIMGDLYAPYVRSGNPVLFMSNRSAELAKYAANSFLAMKISFINDLATLCEKLDAEIHNVRPVMITDSRIGRKFLYAGCGYGGSCFPKDILALIALGKEHDVPLKICAAVHEINERQKRVIFAKIKHHFKNDLKNKTIALWGLAFKPMTDDMREAPAVTLIHQLLEAGCKVQAYDPVALKEAERIFQDRITLFDNGYSAIKGADCLAIMTEWNEFRCPDFDLLKKELKRPVIFDGRNLYVADSLSNYGFTYYCIGKPDPK